jgi:Amt family ammonium transporter
MCGVWGVLAAGLFANESDYIAAYGFDNGTYGLLRGGGGNLFGAAVVAVLAIAAWASAWSAALFFVLRKLGVLRVSEEDEIRGLDLGEHGGAGFILEQPLITAEEVL